MAKVWHIALLLLLVLSVSAEDKKIEAPSPELAKSEHKNLPGKQFSVRITKDSSFLVLQLLGMPGSASLKCEVIANGGKPQPLENIVEDDRALFYADGARLAKACGDAADCFAQFTLLKLGSTPPEKIVAMATTKADAEINMTDQLPVKYPYVSSLEYDLKYEPRGDQLKAALEKGVEIHVQNNFVNMVIKAILTGNQKGDEKAKTYVAGDIWTNIIHIPKEDIALFDDPKIQIQLEEDSKSRTKIVEDDLKKSRMYWTTVQIGSGTKVLENNKYLESYVTESQFKYYLVKKPKKSEGLVILTVLDGEADLYAKRGTVVYPDADTYDIASTSIKDDELTLPSNGNSLDEEEYIIGVLGSTTSRYRISFFVDCGTKVYPVRSGEFIHKYLEKGESLVLKYDIDTSIDKYIVGFMGEHSSLMANAKFYDEYTESFIDSLPNEKREGVIALGPSKFPNIVSRVDVTKPGKKITNQLLVMVTNPDIGQIASAYIVPASGEYPVLLKAGEKISDILGNSTSQTYVFYGDSLVESAVLEVEAHHGTFTVLVTNKDDFRNDANPLKFDIEASQHFARKTINLDLRGNKKEGMGLFRRYLVKIVTKSHSQFSLYGVNKGDSFVQVKASNHNIMRFDPKTPTAFYYRVGKDVKSLMLQFEVKSPVFTAEYFGIKDLNGQDPLSEEFEKLKDITANVDILFVKEEDFGEIEAAEKKGTPANILKSTRVDDRERFYLNLEVEPKKSFLIVRPKKNEKGDYVSDKSFMAVFKLFVNDVYAIGPNYRTSGVLKKDQSRRYSFTVPPFSSVYLVVSICRGADLNMKMVEEDPGLFGSGAILSTKEDSLNTYTWRLNSTDALVQTYQFDLKQVNSTDEDTYFAIKTTQSLLTETITLPDFFDHRIKVGNNYEYFGFKVDQTPYNLTYRIPRAYPKQGFSERYPNTKLIQYDYTVMISNEKPSVYHEDNICDLQLYHDRESYIWQANSEKIQHPFINANVLSLEMERYPRTNPPYYGLLQIRVAVVQEESGSTTADAEFMYKVPFMVYSIPPRPWTYFLWAGICICVVALVAWYFLVFAKNAVVNKIEQDRRGNVHYTAAVETERNTGLELN